MADIVLATKNRGKLREFKSLLKDLEINILLLDDFEGLPDVTEDGKSFEENALKKAKEIAAATGCLAIADDSGLVVDALGGRPGIFSARYAGPGADDDENNRKLLAEMEGVPYDERRAAFCCVIAVSDPGGRNFTVSGSCSGYIASEIKGGGGFGYDPLFYLPDNGCTMAELPPEVKNVISHRSEATGKLKARLPGFLSSLDQV